MGNLAVLTYGRNALIIVLGADRKPVSTLLSVGRATRAGNTPSSPRRILSSS